MPSSDVYVLNSILKKRQVYWKTPQHNSHDGEQIESPIINFCYFLSQMSKEKGILRWQVVIEWKKKTVASRPRHYANLTNDLWSEIAMCLFLFILYTIIFTMT